MTSVSLGNNTDENSYLLVFDKALGDDRRVVTILIHPNCKLGIDDIFRIYRKHKHYAIYSKKVRVRNKYKKMLKGSKD